MKYPFRCREMRSDGCFTERPEDHKRLIFGLEQFQNGFRTVTIFTGNLCLVCYDKRQKHLLKIESVEGRHLW